MIFTGSAGILPAAVFDPLSVLPAKPLQQRFYQSFSTGLLQMQL